MQEIDTPRGRRPKVRTGPRINPEAHDFYSQQFSTTNQGITYVADAFPALYRMTLRELRGRFKAGELMVFLDVCNGLLLQAGLAGQQIQADVEDGIHLEGLDEKHSIDGTALVETLRGLTVFQVAVLEVWARGFWERFGGDDAMTPEDYCKTLK